jgi:hypothetical protein
MPREGTLLSQSIAGGRAKIATEKSQMGRGDTFHEQADKLVPRPGPVVATDLQVCASSSRDSENQTVFVGS